MKISSVFFNVYSHKIKEQKTENVHINLYGNTLFEHKGIGPLLRHTYNLQ